MTEQICRVDKEPDQRVSQGDIFRNVHFIEDVLQTEHSLEVKRILFPTVIVLTQDCDLQQDDGVRWPKEKVPSTQDKKLLSVLVAPLYNAAHFFTGDHLSDLGLKMRAFNKGRTEGKDVLGNNNPRYHFLKFPSDAQLVDSVVDFKHYFSVNVEYLKRIKETQYVCKVGELYREHLSHRFSYFLARIGLPDVIEVGAGP